MSSDQTLWGKRELEDVSTMHLIISMQDALTELSFRSCEPLHLTAVEDEASFATKKRGRRRAFLRKDGLKPPNAHGVWTAEMIAIAQACKRDGWSNERIGELQSIGRSPRAVKSALGRHGEPEKRQ